jgi:hypothetical protein
MPCVVEEKMSDIYERRFVKYFFENGKMFESKKHTIDTLGVVRYIKPYGGLSNSYDQKHRKVTIY